jgi:peptidoglycan/LPS O-acetylase OafA/YrhL
MLIRLFDETPRPFHERLHFPVRMVLVNVAAAAACIVCAFASFAVGFSAGDGTARPIPLSVWMFLWSMAALVAILGGAMGACARSFPWLAAVLTFLFLGMVFAVPGDPDGFSGGLQMGGLTSAVFLLGACAARGYKRWANIRKSARN